MMGKREIGKLSVFDLVISIIIADIAVMIIEDVERTLIEGILPIGILVFIQMATAYITMKNEKIRDLFDGKPSILIANGQINWEEMRRQRYTIDDLLVQTRLQNINDLSKVNFAILETNGNLSIMEKKTNDSTGKENGSADPQHFPLPLIKDGILQKDHLQKIGKDEVWLMQQLQKKGCTRIEDVFYCSFTEEGEIFLQLK